MFIRLFKFGVFFYLDEKCGVFVYLDLCYWLILKFCLLVGYFYWIIGIFLLLMCLFIFCILLFLFESLKMELIEVVFVLFIEYSWFFRLNVDSWVFLIFGVFNLLRLDGKNIFVRDFVVVVLVSGIVEGFFRIVVLYLNLSKIF